MYVNFDTRTCMFTQAFVPCSTGFFYTYKIVLSTFILLHSLLIFYYLQIIIEKYSTINIVAFTGFGSIYYLSNANCLLLSVVVNRR